MTITVQVPRQLRDCCGGTADLSVSASYVQGVLEELERRFPELHRQICDETGRLRPHINLFVNSSYMSDRQGLQTTLQSGDVVTISPAVSGG